jgi:hypothetical protein
VQPQSAQIASKRGASREREPLKCPQIGKSRMRTSLPRRPSKLLEISAFTDCGRGADMICPWQWGLIASQKACRGLSRLVWDFTRSFFIPAINDSQSRCLTDQSILVTGHARNIFTKSTPFKMVKWASFKFHRFFFLKHLRTSVRSSRSEPSYFIRRQTAHFHLIPQH